MGRTVARATAREARVGLYRAEALHEQFVTDHDADSFEHALSAPFTAALVLLLLLVGWTFTAHLHVTYLLPVSMHAGRGVTTLPVRAGHVASHGTVVLGGRTVAVRTVADGHWVRVLSAGQAEGDAQLRMRVRVCPAALLLHLPCVS